MNDELRRLICVEHVNPPLAIDLFQRSLPISDVFLLVLLAAVEMDFDPRLQAPNRH